MIRMSEGPGGEEIHSVVIVAFDAASGQIHGSFTHGSHGPADPRALERDEDRLLAELGERLGPGVALETVRVSLDSLAGGWIERIDLESGEPRVQAEDANRLSRP